jgi:hypothetical protein
MDCKISVKLDKVQETLLFEDAGKMEKWEPRIKVVENYPMFRGFKKGYPLKMQCVMWLSGLLRIMSMVHLKIG